MKNVFFFLMVLMASCNNSQHKNPGSDITGKIDSASSKNEPVKEHKINKAEFNIVDTGQTWFRVIITKNDSAFMDYEGSWPVFFLSGNSATLQLIKSKQLMSVSDGLTIYMNGMPSGTVPFVLFNREKGTASLIFSPVTDGAYGLPVSPTEGSLTITKNENSVVSGKFEGKGTDLNKDVYVFRGYFLNTKINPDKI